MAAHKLNLRQRRELKQFYKDGARDVDLAQWFGISEATVRFHTKEFRRKHPRRTFDRDRAKRLLEQGLTNTAIGVRLGVHNTTISRVRIALGRAA